MEWYGCTHLNPTRTKKLMRGWQAPAGNCAARYYMEFPELYPNFLPDDHYIVKYDESKYPTDRDYRTFKSAPKPVKSSHQVEWENGYGPCNVCEVCIAAATKNHQQSADYYRRLEAWRTNGTPM